MICRQLLTQLACSLNKGFHCVPYHLCAKEDIDSTKGLLSVCFSDIYYFIYIWQTLRHARGIESKRKYNAGGI
jgi:hypothetical protein